MKAKRKSYYMHTLEGRPASFSGWQVCYSVFTQAIELCESRRQLLAERDLSIKNRKEAGMASLGAYGYRRVVLPLAALEGRE